MRCLLPILLFALALPAAAQPAGAFAGTWYALQQAQITVGTAGGKPDRAWAPVLSTLELSVTADSVTGEERRDLTLPAGVLRDREEDATSTAVRAVTGTVDGEALHLTMTSVRGDVLRYEATLTEDGRLALLLVPDAPLPESFEVPTLYYEREPPGE
jgi:hypothetical protein